MIARAPKPSQSLILSSRLGLVSVPDAPRFTAEPGSDEAGFEKGLAQELLRNLGRGLGMSLLAIREEAFPEADRAVDRGVGSNTLDEAVRKTLEGLDAVWMDGDEVVAAFVVEPRAGGWEGLRRLADLLALLPKLKAPLYVVTLPALEAGILGEIHRPVYRLLKKSLAEVLRLLDWDRLRTEVEELGERVRYLKPEFLEGISDLVAPPPAE